MACALAERASTDAAKSLDSVTLYLKPSPSG